MKRGRGGGLSGAGDNPRKIGTFSASVSQTPACVRGLGPAASAVKAARAGGLKNGPISRIRRRGVSVIPSIWPAFLLAATDLRISALHQTGVQRYCPGN